MTPILITPPALEPLTLAEARAWLRLDGAEEDSLVSALIVAARMAVERASGRLLIHQQWRILADGWPPGGRVGLPLAPVSAVSAVRVIDGQGSAETVPGTAYRLELQRSPPTLVLTAPVADPGRSSNGIEIDLTCGYGPAAADVPEPLRHAIRLLVARWFENRGDAVSADAPLPSDVLLLISPFRRPRL